MADLQGGVPAGILQQHLETLINLIERLYKSSKTPKADLRGEVAVLVAVSRGIQGSIVESLKLPEDVVRVVAGALSEAITEEIKAEDKNRGASDASD